MAKRLAGVLLVLASCLMAMPARAVEDLPSDRLTIQAEFPGGDYFEFGLDSLWIMTGPKLTRIDAKDNTSADFWIEGATGEVRGIAIGEGAVWLPDTGNQTIYKFDPSRTRWC